MWLDCEFNGFGGSLISMGIAAADGSEWYEVLECASPTPWVAENVIPVLNKPAVPFTALQASLVAFLKRFESPEIVADWPEDFSHLNRALLAGVGRTYKVPNFTMAMKYDLPPTSKISKVPHNALEDAKALRAVDY